MTMAALPTTGTTRTFVSHLSAGGTLGRHEATMRQVFAVVSGEVETLTGAGPRTRVGPGQLVVWERGESHQTWALTDAVVVVVETTAELDLTGHSPVPSSERGPE